MLTTEEKATLMIAIQFAIQEQRMEFLNILSSTPEELGENYQMVKK